VPDISANAGASQPFYSNSGWNAFVGTSLSSPFIGGLIADIDQNCATSVGLLSQALYTYASSAWSPSGPYGYSLNDITTGNNDAHNFYNGANFAATSGYDLASGLGSPRAASLTCPQITAISPTSGTAGTQVTITGSNLEDAQVTFGGLTAPIVSRAATQLTVTAPSGAGPASVVAATPLGRGTASATFAYPTPVVVVTPLKPSVSLGTSSWAKAGPAVMVTLRCQSATCRGVAQIVTVATTRVRQGKKLATRRVTIVLGSAAYALGKGRSSTVRLSLNAVGRRLIGPAVGHVARVSVKLIVNNGTTTTRTVTVR
jgi:hypothetical protein